MSGLFDRLRALLVGRRSVSASGAVVALSSVALLAAVLTAEGFATARYDLNDGAVWVTSASGEKGPQVGRINTQAKALDSSLYPPAGGLELAQSGRTVLLVGAGAGGLRVIDPVAVEIGEQEVDLPAEPRVVVGGIGPATAIGVLDASDGRLWVRSPESVSSLKVKASGKGKTRQPADRPDAKLGSDAQVVATDDGSILALSVARGEVQRFRVADGRVLREEAWKVPVSLGVNSPTSTATTPPTSRSGVPPGVQLSAVGQRAVILDPTSKRVVVQDGATTELSGVGKAAVVQLPGRSRDSVAVASDSGLFDVPLDGGHVRRLSDAGTGGPVAPAVDHRCVLGAWSASPRLVAACDGGKVAVEDLKGASGGPLRFRVNQGSAVLNDIDGRNNWIFDRKLEVVDNWKDVEPPPDSPTDDSSDDIDDDQDIADPPATANEPPVARDDELGARPGRSAVLPVLDNDSDRNGDLLTVAEVSELSLPGATATVIGNGRAVQVFAPPDAVGAVTFTYKASDGQALSNAATVTVTLRTQDQNEAPRLKAGRRPSMTVVQGQSADHQVLEDWIDPDGDPITLLSASPAESTDAAPFVDEVRTTPAGVLTVTAAGAAGNRVLAVTVTDGALTGTAELKVQVVGADNPPGPVTVDDLASGGVGEWVVVEPLLNDHDPGGSPLVLGAVIPTVGTDVEVEVELDRGVVRLSAPRAGSYVLSYEVSNSPLRGAPKSASGMIRLEVRGEPSGRPPVAVSDVVAVPLGGSALVDVVGNDVSPDGLVLVATAVAAPVGSGVTAALLQGRAVRVSVSKQLPSGRLDVPYRVTDGVAVPVQGWITVIQVQPVSVVPSPVARPDVVTVRVGGSADVAVLANDSSPTGDPLRVRPELTAPEGSGGFVFADVTDGRIRFVAPREPTTTVATYTVEDSQGNRASSTVTFRVVAPADSPPALHPVPLVARVIAGRSVTVAVPLEGIDPEGGRVELVGLGVTRPAKGSVGNLDPEMPDRLVYTADGGGGGTDTFSYQVRSERGVTAEATVRVGIAPNPPTGAAPTAPDVRKDMAPGGKDTIDVLKVSSDPQNRPLRLDPDDPFTVPEGFGLRVTDGPTGPLVEVTAPDLPDGADSLARTASYRIVNDVGGAATGFITLVVRRGYRPPLIVRDAPDKPAPAPEGARSIDYKIVPRYASDPGARPGEPPLAVALPAGFQTAKTSGGVVTVTLTDDEQVIPYVVTNAPTDGSTPQSATALIRVPPKATSKKAVEALSVPELYRDSLSADAGQRVIIKISDHVRDRSGKAVTLTQVDRVSATGSDGSPLVVDAQTLQFTSAKDFAGRASITFEVTNGSGPDDPAGQKRVFTIFIEVKGPTNRPPVFKGTTVTVEQRGPAVPVDLEAFVDDETADAGRHTFAGVSVAGGGVKAVIDGSKMTITADGPKGEQRQVSFTVADAANPPQPASLTVQITASNRPLLRPAVDLMYPKASSGRPATIDVVSAAFNPFDDAPLEIVGTPVIEGSGTGGTVTKNAKGEITYTSAEGYSGVVTVSYVLGDKTGDVERQVPGTVRFNVRGRPSTPTAPAITGATARTVMLRWAEPANNGAPITNYRVETDTGIRRDIGLASNYAFDGLTNGTKYKFRVVAVNEVGDSEPGPWSAQASPDQVPSRPTSPPTLAFGDAKLDVTWAAVTSGSGDFSAVTGYRLQVNGSPYTPPPDQITGLSITLGGLANGNPYRVRYQAINQMGNSEWSDWSAPETPAKAPSPPGWVTAASACSGALAGQATVNWAAPANNGDAVRAQTLFVFAGGTQIRSIPVAAGTTSQNVSGITAGTSYQFEVTATNKAGESQRSARSAAVSPCGPPSTITSLTATPNDRAVTLTFADPAGNGRPLVGYDVQINGGSIVRLPVGQRVVDGLTNGTDYTFAVRACHEACGAFGPASAAVVPYGRPFPPRLEYGGGSMKHWSAFFFNYYPAENGQPIARIEGLYMSGWERELNRRAEVGSDCDHTITLQYRTVDAIGQVSEVATISGATPPCPTARIRAVVANGGTETTNWLGNLTNQPIAAGISFDVACKREGQSWNPARGGYWYLIADDPWHFHILAESGQLLKSNGAPIDPAEVPDCYG